MDNVPILNIEDTRWRNIADTIFMLTDYQDQLMTTAQRLDGEYDTISGVP